ncbi:MAG: fimbrial protein [Rikenellaceae bacterium]|nr:fimbrial protein [Rikenellaceae bacterium]
MKKIFMLALVAVTMLASCSKDEKGGGNVDEGGNAALRMKITLPNATTRAGGEHETLAAESTIEDIYIYVFNNDGSPANDANNGRFGPFDLTNDFDQQLSPNDNTYNMKNPVTTTAGTKKIYVVVNLEENGLAINYGSEQIFLSTIAEVHGDGVTPGLVKFDDATLGVNAKAVESIVLMGNKTQALTSVASGSGDNVVDVDIERTVGRVVTTLNNSL